MTGFLAAGVVLVAQLLLAGLGLEMLLRTLVGPSRTGWADALGYLDAALCAVGIVLLVKLRRLLAGHGWLFTLRRRRP